MRYWRIIYNLLLFICPKFQNLSSHLPEALTCSMNIKQKMCKEKIFRLQSVSNVICVDQCFTVETSGVSCQACLTAIFNLSNPKMKKFSMRKNDPYTCFLWFYDPYTSAALNGVTVGGHVIDIFLLPKKGTHGLHNSNSKFLENWAWARNSLTKSQSYRGHVTHI